jgi:hypothetical protein
MKNLLLALVAFMVLTAVLSGCSASKADYESPSHGIRDSGESLDY